MPSETHLQLRHPAGCWWRVGTCLDLLCCLSGAETETEREKWSTVCQGDVTQTRREHPWTDPYPRGPSLDTSVDRRALLLLSYRLLA
ncbi:hypothetical protein CesoFtcFv8_011190 [Champsocephalus esox]|uniref:Secreted protein n=1 Tax=Champsocephalus esox TaxID=159716 RepID=A0AAN8C0H7_9TELE|nr:hypothetical protein CesoFtcFv8_011190 [Champsocephalus esox]